MTHLFVAESVLHTVLTVSSKGHQHRGLCKHLPVTSIMTEPKHVLRWNNIQGDSGGICTTLGNDSMSDFKQKSSYEHGSDFERLRSYDRLKLGIEGNDY